MPRVATPHPKPECGETKRTRMRAWLRQFNGSSPVRPAQKARRSWPKVSGRIGRDKYLFFGEVLSLGDLAKISGLRPQTIRRRLLRGMPIEDAVLQGAKLEAA